MARPTITRSIKRRRLREMGCDCSEAGQEFPPSAFFSAAGRALATAPRRKPEGKQTRKPKSRNKRAA